MKRLRPILMFAMAVACATSALAQTPSASQTAPKKTDAASAPTVDLGYVGVSTGAAVVQRAGAFVAGEAGIRVRHNLDLSIEAGWMQDVSTRRMSDSAAALAASQGGTAKVTAPAGYGTVNARWVFESDRRFRPYILGGVGFARVEIRSTFSNADNLTLGSDLSGSSTHAAVAAGVGVLIPLGSCFIDAGYRFTSIQTAGQATNVSRANVGFFYKF